MSTFAIVISHVDFDYLALYNVWYVIEMFFFAIIICYRVVQKFCQIQTSFKILQMYLYPVYL